MARWSLERRVQTRRSLNTNTPAPLTAGELRYRRLELAYDVVELTLCDEPQLPPPLHDTLQTIAAVLAELREEAKHLA